MTFPTEIEQLILSNLPLNASIDLLHTLVNSDSEISWQDTLKRNVTTCLRVFCSKADVHNANIAGQPFHQHSVFVNSPEFQQLAEISAISPFENSSVEIVASVQNYHQYIHQITAVFPPPNTISLYTVLCGPVPGKSLAHSENIAKLNISSISADELNTFKPFLNNLTGLTYLHVNIDYSERANRPSFVPIRLPNLVSLEISAFANCEDIIYPLAACSPKLTSVSLKLFENGQISMNRLLAAMESSSLENLTIESVEDDDHRLVSVVWTPDETSLLKLANLHHLHISGFVFPPRLEFLNHLSCLESVSLTSTRDPDALRNLDCSTIIALAITHPNRNLIQIELKHVGVFSNDLDHLSHFPALQTLSIDSVVLNQKFDLCFLKNLISLDLVVRSDVTTADFYNPIPYVLWPPHVKDVNLTFISSDERVKRHSLQAMLPKVTHNRLPSSVQNLKLMLETESRIGKESIFHRQELNVNSLLNMLLPIRLKSLTITGLDRYFPQWSWWNEKFLINTKELELPPSLVNLEVRNAFIQDKLVLPKLKRLAIYNSFFCDQELFHSHLHKSNKLIVLNCCLDQSVQEAEAFLSKLAPQRVQKPPEQIFLRRANRSIFLINGSSTPTLTM
ncbi:hypothetical protein OGAPHI_005018 [Ogataea philodendri]|uniref:Uncharacterized protein n=1 Tax=Ogataea philodendri TaxID=1378263 RepID=A0A9P8P1R0_9ASCO|nr:uncharacterized protein OGAPHI_005018 [Ogataea philodendri]KAH3663617.1 hypothetical protein OGAPHI_005018 [Ogataea philodendri]